VFSVQSSLGVAISSKTFATLAESTFQELHKKIAIIKMRKQENTKAFLNPRRNYQEQTPKFNKQ
jgi:hypothetical protein